MARSKEYFTDNQWIGRKLGEKLFSPNSLRWYRNTNVNGVIRWVRIKWKYLTQAEKDWILIKTLWTSDGFVEKGKDLQDLSDRREGIEERRSRRLHRLRRLRGETFSCR